MKITAPIFAASIVAAALLGFFVGRGSSNSQKSPKKEIAKAEAPNLMPNAAKKEEAVKTPEESKTEAEATKIDSLKVLEAEPISAPVLAAGAVTLPRLNMGISDDKISSILTSISENMEKQKLQYVSSKGQDCSGIYHKLKDSIQNRLPSLAAYEYPKYNSVRSSRQIADWYHKNGNLLIVEDAMASRNSIRPGSVMFFGRPNKKYSNMDIDMLTDRNNNYTKNGAIMHIAVVTSVKTDAEGNVLEYTMMHGRNSRIHASRTGSKEKQSKRKPNLPPFGNWSQQWVAVANIATGS
ncbi:MAG: hypothetical protein AAF696_00700 [Bacteroidota bacterium]